MHKFTFRRILRNSATHHQVIGALEPLITVIAASESAANSQAAAISKAPPQNQEYYFRLIEISPVTK